VAVHGQRHRQRPGQLNQLLAPGACLPEHRQGLIEGPPLAAGAVAARLLRRRSLLEEKQ
jgi:hypothetical protein